MNIEKQVISIVAVNMGKEENEVNLGTNFEEDLGCDSLDMVSLSMEVEDAFKIEIPDNDRDKFSTVADLVNYVGTIQASTAQAVS